MNDQPTSPRMLVDTRSTTHGDFPAQAAFYEAMMKIWESSPNWNRMPPYMRYSIQYETKKQARIACGDFMFIDHWADKSGYIQLVVDELVRVVKERPQPRAMAPALDENGEPFMPGTPEDGGHHARMGNGI